MKIKRLSLLIALVLCFTIGGVYATWVYTQSDDVADITKAGTINMTDATFEGTYGTYAVDVKGATMEVDPKEGTTHTTSLVITGNIVITFTPNVNAPATVKENAVPSTFALALSNPNWKYNDQMILTVDTSAHDIVWGEPDSNGIFTYTIEASVLSGYITFTEFELDTKAKYDAYAKALATGSIEITVSDGKTSA